MPYDFNLQVFLHLDGTSASEGRRTDHRWSEWEIRWGIEQFTVTVCFVWCSLICLVQPSEGCKTEHRKCRVFVPSKGPGWTCDRDNRLVETRPPFWPCVHRCWQTKQSDVLQRRQASYKERSRDRESPSDVWFRSVRIDAFGVDRGQCRALRSS